MHTGPARRGPDWRTWIAVVAIALVGATSTSTLWHGEHGNDRDCTVCQLRHHSVGDLAGAPQVRTTEDPEPVLRAPRADPILTDHTPRLPARAPPA